jgi:hypothetical protein
MGSLSKTRYFSAIFKHQITPQDANKKCSVALVQRALRAPVD